MVVQHAKLADGKWFAMTLAEQLGNIGSEVGRASSWRIRGNKEYFEKAFSRALELLDLSLSDNRWRGAKRREIARAREVVCEALDTESSEHSYDSLNGYFGHFAILARAQKGF